MYRYIIRFEKTGKIRYISHLDLMRLFQRAFKRSEIALNYSKGFNPHPKMSFAQPLSLGFMSVGEYLEFETIDSFDCEILTEKLNAMLPHGVTIIKCRSLQPGKKTVGSTVDWARYEIIFKGEFGNEIYEMTDKYLEQKQIPVMKRQKKDGKMKETDIKPLISEFSIAEHGKDQVKFMALIRAGSAANLNPELLMKAFCEYMNCPYEDEKFTYIRLDLYDKDMNPLVSD